MNPPWRLRFWNRMGRSVASGSRAVWGIRVPRAISAGSMSGPESRKFMNWTATMLSMIVERISLTLK